MKLYLKLIAIYVISLLGTFLLLRFLVDWLLNRPMDAPIWVTSTVWIVLFSMIYWGGLIMKFKPQLDYIQKASPEPPDFESVVTRKLEIQSHDFSIRELLDLLESRYEITYIDEEHQVIKLRDRFSMSSWGACTFIQYREKEGTLLLASYPLSNRKQPQGIAGRQQSEFIALLIRDMNL